MCATLSPKCPSLARRANDAAWALYPCSSFTTPPRARLVSHPRTFPANAGDADAERLAEAGDVLADVAEADDPERLAGEIAHRVGDVAVPRLRRLVANDDIEAPAQDQHHREGVLGDRRAIETGKVRD